MNHIQVITYEITDFLLTPKATLCDITWAGASAPLTWTTTPGPRGIAPATTWGPGGTEPATRGQFPTVTRVSC